MAKPVDFYIEGVDGVKVGFAWDELDPIGFIKLLQEHPNQIVGVTSAPQGWVTGRHVPQLMAMLDSRAPAARVCSVLPAPRVEGDSASTVGLEALKIMKAYRNGKAYMPNCTAW